MTNATRRVYQFGGGSADGDGGMKELLGGKGANLAEMSRLGLPVPPGFTITTEVCIAYLEHKAFPPALSDDVAAALRKVEERMQRRFGDPKAPLLVSVRSGARASMPGMMDTVLNIGLNDRTIEGLIADSGDPRFAYDCYRRLVEMYGDVVMGVSREEIYHPLLEAAKKRRGVQEDRHLPADDLKALVEEFKQATRRHAGVPFPEEPGDQMWGAIQAVFRSWMNDRAIAYRRINRIPQEWGTAVNVQAMVFGNLGDDCGTGVAFTRSPATGETGIYGEFLPNAQGEDVVAGIRTPQPISGANPASKSLETTMPAIYRELTGIAQRLEKHFREMQDIEFTIMKRRLFALQTRRGERTGLAAVRISVEMAAEGMITKEEAFSRVKAERLNDILAPTFDPSEKAAALRAGRLLAKGLNAGPGAASGALALSAEAAARMHAAAGGGRRVILARAETSPEDITGMEVSAGILTARGGMTSHAAVVARGMGKPCVVGCGALQFAADGASIVVGTRTLREGDPISIDGTSGEVIAGEIRTSPPEVLRVLVEKTLKPEESKSFRDFDALLSWADGARRMSVRANADTPHDAAVARALGAQGIGLCRTEHMFFAEERILAVREMILADNVDGRRRALEKIVPMQRSDFAGIFRAMDGLPVTIRLLDPPLHEFLPHEADQIRELSGVMGVPFERLRARVEMLKEANPMLGHRGCRLGITYPEIYEAQARAIFEAACEIAAEGGAPHPEVMIPLVGTAEELRRLDRTVSQVASEVFARTGRNVPFLVGTMIEVPRAALIAGEIAKTAEFFSFGTNDLTQMTWGLSRDDTKNFLPFYVESRVIQGDPFESLDTAGVGRLVELAVSEGRKSRAGLKIGICGEHGGDPASVAFFHRAGLDYVSCSPYRVPIARLAAAQESVRKA
ncbi:MAG: pyruvate, phosphate dikinase [Acidobacteria bacterium]|nr:pyruvate, phosphate dikinase [Acidobacteriota bacterium]